MNETQEPRNQAADIINVDRAQMEKAISSRNYPDRTADLLRWLHGYAVSCGGRKADMLAALGGAIAWPVVYRAMTGNEVDHASMDYLLAMIEALRKREEEEQASRFAENPVTRKIWKTLDYARDRKSLVVVCGPTGRGKTETALRWAQANNHGRTIYVRATAGSSKRTIVQAIARAVGIGAGRTRNSGVEELLERILSSLGSHNMLIIDECGHLFPSGNRGTEAMDVLRDIHDITGCGMCLLITDYYYNELKKGRHSVFFEQLNGRVALFVPIPRRIFKEEVEAAVRLHVKNPDPELISAVMETARAEEGQLRPLYKYDLPTLIKVAKNKGKTPSRKMWMEVVNYRKSAGAEDWPQE